MQRKSSVAKIWLYTFNDQLEFKWFITFNILCKIIEMLYLQMTMEENIRNLKC